MKLHGRSLLADIINNVLNYLLNTNFFFHFLKAISLKCIFKTSEMVGYKSERGYKKRMKINSTGFPKAGQLIHHE